MKKYLVVLTALGITVSAVPEPVMAASASVATANAASYEQQTDAKQRRHHGRRDRRWNNNRRWGYRTVCRREWRRGRPHRVCRQVRFRRW